MSAEQSILEAIVAYLGRRLGPRAVLRVVKIEATAADGVRHKLKMKPGEGLGTAPGQDGENTTPIRSAVIAVLLEAEKPLKAAAIAKRAERANSGIFRTTMAEMVREGILVLGAAGYALAEQEGENSESDGG